MDRQIVDLASLTRTGTETGNGEERLTLWPAQGRECPFKEWEVGEISEGNEKTKKGNPGNTSVGKFLGAARFMTAILDFLGKTKVRGTKGRVLKKDWLSRPTVTAYGGGGVVIAL